MDYKYNEIEYAKQVYENGFLTKHIPTELRLLAIYFRDILELKPKGRREKLYAFCELNIPSYNKAKHFRMINRALTQSTNKMNKLISIDKVDIYQSEVDYINSINLSDNHKKIMFTLLVHKKLSRIVFDIKNSDSKELKEYTMSFFKGGATAYDNIKKMANVPISVRINQDIIHDLSTYLLYDINDAKNKTKVPKTPVNLVTILTKGSIRLNYMDEIIENGDVTIEVKNFNNVGLYLDYYNSVDKIKLCKQCNQPFKQNKNDIFYCSEHKEYYVPSETKTIECIDCKGGVIVDSLDNQTNRCKDCYDIHRKNKVNENVKNYRKRNKLKDM